MRDNDQIYADACFPAERWSVCGVKLLPFSIGHADILQSIGSPFLDFRVPEFDDLMLALWVCSNRVTPGTNSTSLKLPLRWRLAARFLRRICKDNPRRFWGSIIVFQQYVFDSLWFKPPIATRNMKLSRASTCPAFLPMKRTLMSHWNYSEAEALNMSLKQAKMEHAAWLEHEGALSFKTQADTDIIEEMKRPENVAWAKKVREEAEKRKALKSKA